MSRNVTLLLLFAAAAVLVYIHAKSGATATPPAQPVIPPPPNPATPGPPLIHTTLTQPFLGAGSLTFGSQRTVGYIL
jgi:hypothetical protein